MAKNQKPPVTYREPLLARYQGFCDAIAAIFFPYAEVVVHDLGTQSVVYIANNISKRMLGDASALDNIEFDSDENVLGPFEKLNWDGRAVRSVSIVVRDDQQQAIGVICLNLNIAVFEQARAALDLFVKGAKIVPQPDKLFKDDWQERINTYLHHWLQQNQLGLSTLSREHKRQLVHVLYEQGAFNGKSAANYVANVLDMGRATVFKHLKEIKEKNQ
ncbi:Transcriptional regulator DauR [Ephemeroptericola cinctiostellae]|uniref:Transcriptional regulator DauR n=1 Tax=Ephemeroptericola cinctiostellae TaxID=2268024 RepID=A0A345D9J4_9BURK|nr:PAS domain-containing protein [Ephemeroptericola cinctiostellae]AXF85032.1 Transcriptional regulator DauR [Ephemeroptericola cinctiostellae]